MNELKERKEMGMGVYTIDLQIQYDDNYYYY